MPNISGKHDVVLWKLKALSAKMKAPWWNQEVEQVRATRHGSNWSSDSRATFDTQQLDWHLLGGFNPSEKWWSSPVGMIIPKIWKIKHVPNHQPGMDWFFREHLQFAPSSLPKPQKALDVGSIGILHVAEAWTSPLEHHLGYRLVASIFFSTTMPTILIIIINYYYYLLFLLLLIYIYLPSGKQT